MLHVERSGSGDPVLLLHGAAGSSAAPTAGCPTSGARSCGWTSAATDASDRADSYLLGDYAEDALSVLREHRPAPVVGHSLGGVVAWTLAQRVPELVTGIVLEDPPLYMGEPAEHARNPAMPHFGVLREPRCAGRPTARRSTTPRPRSGAQDRIALADDAHRRARLALLRLDPRAIDPIVDGTALAATDLRHR